MAKYTFTFKKDDIFVEFSSFIDEVEEHVLECLEVELLSSHLQEQLWLLFILLPHAIKNMDDNNIGIIFFI